MREQNSHLSAERGGALQFGPIRLDIEQRRLFRDAEPVPVASRALEIPVALVDRPGELVAKEELFARVWPHLAVEESNLRAQILGLRKALDEERLCGMFVFAVPGRGYRFVEPVSPAAAPPPPTRRDRSWRSGWLAVRCSGIAPPGGKTSRQPGILPRRLLCADCLHHQKVLDLTRFLFPSPWAPQVYSASASGKSR